MLHIDLVHHWLLNISNLCSIFTLDKVRQYSSGVACSPSSSSPAQPQSPSHVFVIHPHTAVPPHSNPFWSSPLPIPPTVSSSHSSSLLYRHIGNTFGFRGTTWHVHRYTVQKTFGCFDPAGIIWVAPLNSRMPNNYNVYLSSFRYHKKKDYRTLKANKQIFNILSVSMKAYVNLVCYREAAIEINIPISRSTPSFL